MGVVKGEGVVFWRVCLVSLPFFLVFLTVLCAGQVRGGCGGFGVCVVWCVCVGGGGGG
jgi:hypothetical protein